MIIDLRMTRLMVTAHDGAVVGDLSPREVLGIWRTDELNGEHTLTVRTTQQIYKNDRILLQDGTLRWYEYVVQGEEDARVEGGLLVHEYWCVWSLQHDLSETYIDTQVGLVPGHASIAHPARDGMEAALSGTDRWGVGTITVTTMASGSFYRRSGWEGLSALVEHWGGEIDAEIEVGQEGVTSRSVALLNHVGATEATRRFDYGSDLLSIKRTVVDDPWTARIVPLGKSRETEAGGYTRRPTIAGVNDGIVWLEDPDAIEATRVPDGRGGWEHPVQIVLNDTYEEPADLMAWAQERIKDYTQPRVKYEATVNQFEEAGLDALGVGLGDEVAIVDRGFIAADLPDGLRLDGRVVKIKADLLDPTATTITLGTLSYSVAKRLHGLSGRIEAVESQIIGMSEVQATAEYLGYLIGALNDEINATGGYTYITEGEGIRTYDVAVSDPLVGREAHKVVEIKGGSIRIADSRTSGGDWDWKTVFVSGHIASDLVTAAQITAGFIGSAGSGNYWDLDTGELRMASTATLGGRTVQQILDGVDATITGVDVQFAENQSTTTAPLTGWSTTAPAWRDGWYIWQRTATTTESGTTYSEPTCISGRDGTDGADGTSVTILGSYNTLAELQAAHPTGSMGDGYMVGGDLYVWNGSAWEDVGTIQGPQGAAGPQGPAGTSVTVSSIQYGVSDNSSVAPSSWSATAPSTIAKGKWLWVRTTYSDGSAATTKSYVGTDGEDGSSVYVQSSTKVGGVTTVVLADTDGQTTTLRIADGADGPEGTPGATGYVHVAWANSQDGYTDFSTTDSVGKSYLGVYTDEVAADSSDPTRYSWSRIEGEQGATGRGVAGVTEQYYLSTSEVTPTGGSWSAAQPDWEKGKFIWTRTIVTWTDGTATITDPILAEAFNGVYEKVENLKISAVNLVRNGDFSNALSYWTQTGASMEVKSDTTFESFVQANQTGAGGVDHRVYASLAESFRHETGKTYSISFWARANRANAIWCCQGVSKTEALSYVYGKTIGTGWQRFTGTITATTDGGLNFFLENAGTLSLSRVMLVEGDKPMLDWSPDPRDALVPVDKFLTQEQVFNRLTNNGAIQGLYMSGGNLYVNANYIKTGTLSAELINAMGSSQSRHVTIANGGMTIYSDATTVIGQIGYGTTKSNSGTTTAPYYTLGTRGGTDSEIGAYSLVAGKNNKASSSMTVALGENNVASGTFSSVAIGRGNTASGSTAVAIGNQCKATGGASLAIGSMAEATGEGAVAIGVAAKASSNMVAMNRNYSTSGYVLVVGSTTSQRSDKMRLDDTGQMWVAYGYTQASDRRLKEHLAYLGDPAELEGALDFVRRLKPAMYVKDGTRHVGFYAQDVQEAEPEDWATDTVTEQQAAGGSVGFNPLSLDYTALIAPLVAYAQHLERRIEQLEERLEELA